jgi:hypothetical protein
MNSTIQRYCFVLVEGSVLQGKIHLFEGELFHNRRIFLEKGLWDGGVSRGALAHQRNKGKMNFPQVDLQGNLGVKDLESNLSKMSLGHERG